MKYIPLLLILAWVVSGCSTTLHTYDTDKNEMKGVPVPKPQLVKVITTTLYEAIGGATWPNLCSKNQVDESYDYIASGEHYYVNFDPSESAKGTFELNFNDKGLLSKVSVNSEANTGVDSTVGAGEQQTLSAAEKRLKVA